MRKLIGFRQFLLVTFTLSQCSAETISGLPLACNCGNECSLGEEQTVTWNHNEVSGHLNDFKIVVRNTDTLMQVNAFSAEESEYQYSAVFSLDQLHVAGFPTISSMQQCVDTMRSAMEGHKSLKSEVRVDGNEFVLLLKYSVQFFQLEYRLPLTREKMSAIAICDRKTLAMQRELSQLKKELAAKELRITELNKTVATLKQRVNIPFEFSDITKTKVSTAFVGFDLSVDRKTADAKIGEAQIVLKPAVTNAAIVTFTVENMNEWFAIGVVDAANQWLSNGCYFSSFGTVKINGKKVSSKEAFGGWKKGDRLILQFDVTRGILHLRAPKGEYSATWKPRSSKAWFAVYSRYSGTKLTIEKGEILNADWQWLSCRKSWLSQFFD